MGGASRRFAVGVFAAYALWRCNEVFLAFISDATADLRPTAHATNLKYYERIRLAIRSYIELILAYGLVFRAASEFFGGVTITTIGYGDIHPTHWLPGFFTIYEFLNGVVLIVVSFTVYVSRSIAASEFSSHNADSDRPGR
jgi:voltage-gated potassium channel